LIPEANEYQFRQPILADEVQTFKALITIHEVLQEGHPVTIKEAQANLGWLESLTRGVSGEGIRGMFFLNFWPHGDSRLGLNAEIEA
jgi:hypothetical protein